MRLIDEESIVIAGDAKEIDGEIYIKADDANRCLEETPTAYDPDKVVEELEAASYETASSFDEDGYSNDDSEEVVFLDRAIEIVKKGGVK